MKKAMSLVLIFCLLFCLTGCLEGHYIITEDGQLVKIDDGEEDIYVPGEDAGGMEWLCYSMTQCELYGNMDQCFDEGFKKSDSDLSNKCIEELDAFYFCMSERDCQVLEGYYFGNANAPVECKEEDNKVASCAFWGMIGL